MICPDCGSQLVCFIRNVAFVEVGSWWDDDEYVCKCGYKGLVRKHDLALERYYDDDDLYKHIIVVKRIYQGHRNPWEGFEE